MRSPQVSSLRLGPDGCCPPPALPRPQQTSPTHHRAAAHWSGVRPQTPSPGPASVSSSTPSREGFCRPVSGAGPGEYSSEGRLLALSAERWPRRENTGHGVARQLREPARLRCEPECRQRGLTIVLPISRRCTRARVKTFSTWPTEAAPLKTSGWEPPHRPGDSCF